MDTRRALRLERLSALAAMLLALLGVVYLIAAVNRGWSPPHAAAPAATGEAAAYAVRAGAGAASRIQAIASTANVEQPLLFPLAGFEGALRDNFHEARGARRHKALDIMAPRGTPVLAVDDGRIGKLYRGPLAGIAVYQFDPSSTRVYFYAHLERYAPGLKAGQAVRRGDVIGYVGSTGNAPEHAPHLHFAIHQLDGDKRWWKGKAINPYAMLRPPVLGAR